VPRPRQGGRWQPKSLSQVFRNPILTGRRVDEHGRTVLKVEPVLDAATWEKLLAELDRKAAPHGAWSRAPTALLTGIAVCGTCGGPMYKINSSSKAEERDQGQHVSTTDVMGPPGTRATCANMVPMADLENWLDEQLRS